MTRRRQTSDHPVLVCSIQGSSAFKMDGDGSGKLTLTYDATQVDVVTELQKHYREQELHVTFLMLGESP